MFVILFQDQWILCDVRLYKDDAENYFLCLESVSSRDSFSDLTLGTRRALPGTISMKPFRALVQLGEYKTCEIRAVKIHNVGSYSLRLIPSGMFGGRKLTLGSHEEDQIISWHSVLQQYIGKRGGRGSSSGSQFEFGSSIRGDSDLCSTISRYNTEPDNDTLRANTPPDEALDDEMDMMVNDIYEPYAGGNWDILLLLVLKSKFKYTKVDNK